MKVDSYEKYVLRPRSVGACIFFMGGVGTWYLPPAIKLR